MKGFLSIYSPVTTINISLLSEYIAIRVLKVFLFVVGMGLSTFLAFKALDINGLIHQWFSEAESLSLSWAT